MEILRGRTLACQCAKEGGRIDELLSWHKVSKLRLRQELHMAKELLILAGLELYSLHTPTATVAAGAGQDGR